MPVQAIPLALVSSLYPLGLAAVLLLSKATGPRAKEAVFLAGAAVICLTVGFVVVLSREGTEPSQGGGSSGSYGLEVAIGVFFLAAAAMLARRPPKQHDGPSRITRAATEGGLVAVFVAGVVLYLPSPFYLSALNVTGTAGLSTTAAVLWVIAVAAINLLTVEVPVLLFLLAPAQTGPKLGAVTDWLDRNERTVLVVLLAVLGLWEVINGLAGLLRLAGAHCNPKPRRQPHRLSVLELRTAQIRRRSERCSGAVSVEGCALRPVLLIVADGPARFYDWCLCAKLPTTVRSWSR